MRSPGTSDSYFTNELDEWLAARIATRCSIGGTWKMRDLNDLYYFVRVVDHGGFSSAGRAEGIPKSRLSRRIAALEEQLGVQLLYRNTHQLSLTDLGRAYYDHCVAMLAEAQAAEDIISQSQAVPRGKLRISCPPALMHYVVADLLAEFMAQSPQVELTVDVTGRRVDPIKEGVDLALRVRFPPLEDSDLSHRVLSQSPQRLMASPALIARHIRPCEPSDLAALPSLDWEHPSGKFEWCLEGPDGSSVTVAHHPRLVTDDFTSLYKAAVAGLGVVQLPLLIASAALKNGDLLELLPGWQPRGGIVHAVFPKRRGLQPAVRYLLDFLVAGFAATDVDSISSLGAWAVETR